MTAKIATRRTRFVVNTSVTVPLGSEIPSAKAIREAFKTGLDRCFDMRRLMVGKLQAKETVPTAVKGGKSKPKPKPKPKPKAVEQESTSST